MKANTIAIAIGAKTTPPMRRTSAPWVKECVPEVIPFKEYKPLVPQLGIPELTVKTEPVVPIPNLLKVFVALA